MDTTGAPSGPAEPRADEASGPSVPAGQSDDAGSGLGPQALEVDRDLFRRARELRDLDLSARPDAIEELDSAIVAELRAIEDL